MLAEWMDDELGLEKGFVEKIARRASHLYKSYAVPKRTGGTRVIHHPAKELKALQRWLCLRVLSGLPIHDSATAYRRGASIRENASRHVSSRFLLRLDLTDFFPSICYEDIVKLLTDEMRKLEVHTGRLWEQADIGLVCRLATRRGVLTIGAPTSPVLSNAVMLRVDADIEEFCGLQDVIYTRYADDLFLSTSRPGQLRECEEAVRAILVRCECPRRLMLNEQKTFHSSRKDRRVVTGVVLTSQGELSVGRPLKRKIRALILRQPQMTGEQKVQLAGLLAQCRSIEPDMINRLILSTGRNTWPAH